MSGHVKVLAVFIFLAAFSCVTAVGSMSKLQNMCCTSSGAAKLMWHFEVSTSHGSN